MLIPIHPDIWHSFARLKDQKNRSKEKTKLEVIPSALMAQYLTRRLRKPAAEIAAVDACCTQALREREVLSWVDFWTKHKGEAWMKNKYGDRIAIDEITQTRSLTVEPEAAWELC